MGRMADTGETDEADTRAAAQKKGRDGRGLRQSELGQAIGFNADSRRISTFI